MSQLPTANPLNYDANLVASSSSPPPDMNTDEYEEIREQVRGMEI